MRALWLLLGLLVAGASPALAASPPGAAGVPAEMDELAAALAVGFKRYCDQALPGFAQQVAPDWERWRSQHLALVRRVETDPGYLAAQKDAGDGWGNFTRADARFVCAPEWVRGLLGEPAANAARFATPDATWGHFLEALARADRKAALDCYLPASRAVYGRLLEGFSDEDLKRHVAALKLAGTSSTRSNEREYFFQVGEGGAVTVRFLRANGRWFIQEM